MRVAILCPGKTLSESWPAVGKQRKYDEIVAVTTAIEADADFTVWCIVDKLDKRYKARARGLELWNSKSKTGAKWRGSFFVAILMSLKKGAKAIDIYGHDMEGYCNYHAVTGDPLPNCRSAKHWNNMWRAERATWLKMRTELMCNGVEINEVRPAMSR